MKPLGIILASGLLFGSCCGENTLVDGRFTGCGNRYVYLEKVLPDHRAMQDSVKADKKGNFKFRVNMAGGQPTLYNLWCKDETIPLMLAPGQRVKVSSMCRLSHNYRVRGSEDSERMLELRTMLSEGASRLDSMKRAYVAADREQRAVIAPEYSKEYYAVKRRHIEFIVSRPGEMSSLYALYQRLPDERYLSGQESDIVYYRLVADSLEVRHPGSPYLAALRKEIDRAESTSAMARRIVDACERQGQNYPEIEMSDAKGEKHTLSSNNGKVVLVDFWSSTSVESRMNNAEMKNLYADAAPRGFEIYQVSVDERREDWAAAVEVQQLPWISVCDFKGGASPAVRTYGLRSVPGNFIIDRSGNIVAKNVYGDSLTRKIAELLK